MRWESRGLLALVLSKITLLDLFSDSQQTLFGNAHLLMLKDADFRVRFQVCRDIAVLFAVYEEHESLFGTILNMLSPMLAEGTLVDVRLTPLLTLGSIARVSLVNELNIVFQICSTWSESSSSVAQIVLEGVAHDLGYKSLAGFLTELLPELFDLWLAASLPLQRFPVQFWGFSSLSSFVSAYSSFLVPKCVFHEKEAEIRWIATQCKENVKQLLRPNLPAIFAHVKPLEYVKQSPKATRLLESFLLRLGIPEDELFQHLTANVDDYLFALLNVLANGDSIGPPSYSAAVVKGNRKKKKEREFHFSN